ncbi:hypothetical protein [Defluviitalea raffinosedens]|jgi:hypothetical protein|uniref:Uncharacterized protein n=1 Tax=Defluviitalea raffinosedens TaxID=1450156 RepID=A0A7C8HG44_9FIRM|nr:hypothetical protein [Defluviitalea raffinosedens]KAE9629460.1 hypothetical protein GND95_13275 [Defluviitalea raffinosedens]MBM7686989.1 exonuclease VII large subunit [Defluviitalea raffinosedens]MBZ4667908.1 hypothetical protein [Defluviitaleaceae bacterium]HHW66461.1 hypothetical protein [Candidatus Epulonipiscium sp.]
MKCVKIMIALFLLLILAGCSNDEAVVNRVINQNNVDQVIDQLIEQTETENNSTNLEIEPSNQSKGDMEKWNASAEKSENEVSDVDYDLTKMSSDMVYAMVYQMVFESDEYVGKTFRLEGKYYTIYYDLTKKYYHYCLIEDALACCSQGIEFVWGDGSHVYPDEYPQEGTKIVVQGTFETYKEDGDDYLYCRLKDATMEIVNE